MSTEFYTEPRMTMEQLKERMPEGYSLATPTRLLMEEGIEQYLVVCPNGHRLWAYVEPRDPKDPARPGQFVKGTVRFERFGGNDAWPFLEALERSAGVRAYDEFDLDSSLSGG